MGWVPDDTRFISSFAACALPRAKPTIGLASTRSQRRCGPPAAQVCAREAAQQGGTAFACKKTVASWSRQAGASQRLQEVIGRDLYCGIKIGLKEAFVISESTKSDLLTRQPEVEKIIRPWLDGDEMLRWRPAFSGQYLIEIASSANHDWPLSGAATPLLAEEIFREAYPLIFEHFQPYADRLKRRVDQGKYWWELRSCSYWDAFDQPKLIYNETSKNLHAFVDRSGLCLNNTGFLLIHPELEYLLGVFTSSALDFFYRRTLLAWGDPLDALPSQATVPNSDVWKAKASAPKSSHRGAGSMTDVSCVCWAQQ